MIGTFELFYPIVMSLIWIIGALFYEIYSIYQVKQSRKICKSQLDPSVDIFMSCYNEETVLGDAVKSLEQLEYSNYSLILIDDLSTDHTLSIMRDLEQKYSNIKIIASNENKGKASELNAALSKSTAKYILCVDADSIFDKSSLSHLVNFLELNPKCGAVTGRPMVKNTRTILGKLQFLEYYMNIDFIKRAQFLLTNRILTISGVLTLFRRNALENVHGWNPSAMTEDIDITWRLYQQKWLCGYEPHAICHIFVPETISGFLNQRKRWAWGGVEVLRKRMNRLFRISWGEGLLTLDVILSYVWIFLVSISFLQFFFTYLFQHNLGLRLDVITIYFGSTLLFYFISRLINSKNKLLHVPWGIFWLLPVYFYLYWLYNIIVTFMAFYHLFDNIKYAAWGESDRGNIQHYD